MAASRKAGGQHDFQHALIRMGQHIFPHPYPVGYKIIHRRLGQDLLKITAALAGADVCRPGNVFQADPARVFPVESDSENLSAGIAGFGFLASAAGQQGSCAGTLSLG